ncbi:MAG TPA: isoprenylcysteine carboxylmethyltransferase family protein [Rhodothermales bacterium]
MALTTRERARHVVGSALFLLAAPGVVAGLIPYWLTGWRPHELPPAMAVRVFGLVLVALGSACLLECFARFALEGEGTPAPVAPTRHLVVTGAYRYVRNPMYVAVLGIVFGQALLLGSPVLLGYGLIVWVLFHLFVVLYEEPTLKRRYGDSYRTYVSNVRRWWPRLRPWNQARERARR